MRFNKIKSIYLVCSGYFFWILIDTIFWIHFEPQRQLFIIEFNSSMLLAGCLVCTMLVLLQLQIINTFSSKQIFSIAAFFLLTLFFSILLACFNGLISSYLVKGKIHLETNSILMSTFSSFTLLIAIMGLFYFYYYYNLSLQQKEQIKKTKALADEAQLIMLRYQINPHFLFNSLNAIQSMVEKDKFRAKEMIADLSDFFRYTLSKNNQMLVPLKEEIEAIKKYLAIQEARFAGRIKISYEIEEASLNIMLPFFLIHPLVENAIKYGFASGVDMLCLFIKVTWTDETLSILIQNTGTLSGSENFTGKEPVSTKTGIENIRKRLSLFYPDRSVLELFEKDNCVNALITIKNPGTSI